MTTQPKAAVPPPGIYVPTVTFYKDDDTLDEAATAEHVIRMARGGMSGLVVQGTNGESVHLDDEERRQAIQVTRKALDDNGFKHIPIIAGTGQMSLKATLATTRIAKDAGAAFSLAIAPHYWPGSMTKPVLIDYYTKLADQSVLPVIIYNFPGVTAGIDFDSDTILALALHPNIVGAKFTCGNVGKIHRVAAHTDTSSFAAIGGKSDFLIHGLLAGSTGAICGLCNLFPKVHVDCYQKYMSGDLKGALKLQDLLADADSVGPKIGGIPGLKTAVQHYFGYGSAAVRAPLLPVGKDKLKAAEELYGKLLRLENAL